MNGCTYASSLIIYLYDVDRVNVTFYSLEQTSLNLLSFLSKLFNSINKLTLEIHSAGEFYLKLIISPLMQR